MKTLKAPLDTILELFDKGYWIKKVASKATRKKSLKVVLTNGLSDRRVFVHTRDWTPFMNMVQVLTAQGRQNDPYLVALNGYRKFLVYPKAEGDGFPKNISEYLNDKGQ